MLYFNNFIQEVEMKTSEILNLSLKEFERELSLINHEFVQEVYLSTTRALVRYKEEAERCKESEYLGINEYFNINRENSDEYKNFLDSLFN
ncbi:hypothetical protein NNC19_18745 [Clostridium sp. SHJSY1]|uniref:hypothetical protein n=1 Tax=Clostridium sp. SHJSY1 TaxID=2942483 RepID=UPI0028749634|nr:hypothetical protein [Clostridium sp. SHJSY1]MDS0527732.1 hypothetical protein [Clostridium sp. SHJSY1]